MDEAKPIVIDASPSLSPLSSNSTALSPPPPLDIGLSSSKRVIDLSTGKSTFKKDPSTTGTKKPPKPKQPKVKENGVASSSKTGEERTTTTKKVKKEKAAVQEKEKEVKVKPKKLKIPAVTEPKEPPKRIPPHFKKPEEMEVYDDKQKIEDDWQVAYIWAFLDKFGYNVTGIYCIKDLENALKAPDADLALVNLFWEFLQDLKPQVEVIAKASKGSKVKGEDEKGKGKARAWVRPADPTEKKHNERITKVSELVEKIIADRLNWEAATIWDPYTYQVHVSGISNTKGSAPDLLFGDEDDDKKDVDSTEKQKRREAMMEGLEGRYWLLEGEKPERVKQAVGRNPLVSEEGSKAIWELKWQQRTKILRQMIDWILVENERIKEVINEIFPKQRKREPVTAVTVAPLEQIAKSDRIWSIEDSFRIYTSGNPNRMECPMTTIADDKEAYERIMNQCLTRELDIPQLTATWNQASAKKRQLAKSALDKAKAEVSIGRKMAEKIQTIEQAIQSRAARHAQDEEDRIKAEEARIRNAERKAREEATRQKRQERALNGLGGGGLYDRGYETRGRTRATINYTEQDHFDDEFEDEPSVPVQRGKRSRNTDDDEDDYAEIEETSESSSKKRRGLRSGLRSAGLEEEEDDSVSFVQDDEGDEDDEDDADVEGDEDDSAAEEDAEDDDVEEEDDDGMDDGEQDVIVTASAFKKKLNRVDSEEPEEEQEEKDRAQTNEDVDSGKELMDVDMDADKAASDEGALQMEED